jgi:outer membrane protein assembly factor BamB
MLWNVPTPLHVEGSPAIDGDVAVAGAGAIEVGPDHQARGDPGYVLAVRLSDGKQLWKYPVNDPESSPAIRDGVAYIGSGLNGSHLVALRIESDEDLRTSGRDRLVWKVPTPYPATGTVTLADDLVLLGCGNGDYVVTAADPKGAVVAFDRATGAVRWQEDVADAVLGPIAVRDGVAVCPIRNGEVVALDLRKPSGGSRLLWRQRVSGRAAVLAGCAFTGTHVYAVSNDGYLAVLDARDGKVLERHYLNAKDRPGEMGLTLSSPFVVNGRVYVGSETGGLRCFAWTEAP